MVAICARCRRNEQPLLLGDVFQKIQAGETGGQVIGNIGMAGNEGLRVRALAGPAGGEVFVDDAGQK